MTQLKQSLPPQAQARAQEWFDVASVVATTKGKKVGAKDRSATTDFWTYEDDKVKIEKWGVYDTLSVVLRGPHDERMILVTVSAGVVRTWAPEEDVLDYLKSLVPLELLAGL